MIVRALRYRLTVRRLMIAVAIVAMFLAAETARRRRVFCLACAANYADRAQFHRRLAEEERPSSPRLKVENEELANVYEHVSDLYRRAASRPWEALPRIAISPLSSARLSELGDD